MRIRHVMLNTQKCQRFITKGISLTPSNPVCMIPPDLDPEFMNRIDKAIKNEELIEVEDAGIAGLYIPGKFERTAVKEDPDTKVVGEMTYEWKTDEHGNKTRYKVYKFFSDEASEDTRETQPKVISLFPAELTKITDEEE